MFEAIYISPSCKQSKNFIYDLAEKLRQNGISNFESDIRHSQIRSNKFIISAVDIGMSPRPSFHGVKYYIDGFNYVPQNCSFERLCDWAEHIKYRFQPDTKEISEEELIEILTEVSTHD